MGPRKKLIFLTYRFPSAFTHKIKNHNAARCDQIMRQLSQDFEVEVLCFRKPKGGQIPRQLIPDGLTLVEIAAPTLPFWKRILAFFGAHSIEYFNAQIAAHLQQRASEKPLLWISGLEMSDYLPLAHRLGLYVIFDQQNIHPLQPLDKRLSSAFEIPLYMLKATQKRLHERDLYSHCNMVITSSSLEASRLTKLLPKKSVQLIPDILPNTSFTLASSSQTPRAASADQKIVFVAELNTNESQEGVQWFLREVFPRLKATLGVRLPKIQIIGPKATKKTKTLLASSEIELIEDPGVLDSARSHYQDALLVFFPFRSEPENHLPLLEALACGKAVVCTPKSAEGLDVSPSYDIWMSDRPDGFTSAIVRMLSDSELRAQTGVRAAQTILKYYTPEQNQIRFKALIQKIADTSVTLI